MTCKAYVDRERTPLRGTLLAMVPRSHRLPNVDLKRALLAVAAAGVVSSCGGAAADDPSTEGRLDVAAAFYPYQFVAERVGGSEVTVTNLTKAGAEPHDVELTAQQVAGLGEADLVVYSRGFQPLVDEAVDAQAKDQAYDVLTAVQLRVEPEGGKDPHVWLDPVRLGVIAVELGDRLAERAPERAAGFRQRAAELQTELGTLDEQLRTGLRSCQRKQLVTSHDAYGYLAGAYGLEQVPIAGLSPDDEASPGRLAEIATQARADGVTTIFFEELVSPKVSESLAREVGAKATVLSALEGPPESGDYLSAMQENLTTLRTALSCS